MRPCDMWRKLIKYSLGKLNVKHSFDLSNSYMNSTGLDIYAIVRSTSRTEMNTFTESTNLLTGKKEWCLQNKDYDYHQEIARSAYADMLHDTERNKKYEQGLVKAIKNIHSDGREAHVLDIGTGTGLLSMMAVRAGAETVTACEAFKPMADCAKEIMRQNGFADKIHLIPKRSTDIRVGPGEDMPHRCNILVTEVFDTELIGEGGLGTFKHALKHLLEKDCIVVPTTANLYVQLISSDSVKLWNQLQSIDIDNVSVHIPDKFSLCGGVLSLHDLQLNQLHEDKFTILSDPLHVFRFDFSGYTEIEFNRKSEKITSVLQEGSVDAFFMWWDLEFDRQNEISLSCAPHWAHPEKREVQWRDHWMQAIYYPPSSLTVQKSQNVVVRSFHDEYSLWFDVVNETGPVVNGTENALLRPVCTCGIHTTCSRSRLGMMNDTHRNEVFIDALRKNINPDSVCLVISDGSLLPLFAARLGAKHVYTLESNLSCQRLINEIVEHNGLCDKITVLEKELKNITVEDFNSQKVDVVIAEPYFQLSVLPWHNIYYWYALRELSAHMSESTVILPSSITVKAIGVEFRDLWKIRAPVGQCEGFNLQAFDRLVEKSSNIADSNVEPQPLWEYPCKALTEEKEVFKLTFFCNKTTETSCTTSLPVTSNGSLNGVALWTEYSFDGHSITTGPVSPIHPGQYITWDPNTRQGVHLPKNIINLEKNNDSKIGPLQIVTDFKPTVGELTFSFTSENKASR